ncbi:MAG TPA: YegS/Rv2252/BmrU family lipid kinase [Chloroflexota bacterium]
MSLESSPPPSSQNLALPRTLVLVGNSPVGRKARRLEEAHRAMAAEGLQVVDTIHFDQLERLQDWVRRPAGDRPMIVAAGGDGTVGATANYVANTEAMLGILPLGTSNDIARSLRIPVRIESAVHVLAHGRVATIDAGQFMPEGGAPRTFVHAAAMGIDVKFAQMATKSSIRKRLGPFTYVVAGLVALRSSEPFTCELRYDGRTESLRLLHLSVVNAPIFGGLLGLTLPGSDLDDRRLDVLAIEDMPLYRLILGNMRLLVQKHVVPHGVHVYHLSRLDVYAVQTLAVTLDGEVVGHIPGHFILAGEALRVVAPQSFADIDDE